MTTEIECNVGCCWTIAFKNISLGDEVFVWVCSTRDKYNESMRKLQAMPHITIVQHGAGHIK